MQKSNFNYNIMIDIITKCKKCEKYEIFLKNLLNRNIEVWMDGRLTNIGSIYTNFSDIQKEIRKFLEDNL